ncbi:MAG TPA: FkbM family methyltransferase [Granulicella sp.]|nr:FkbM family methyltransferase [Granulicella sp.]
MDVAEPYQLVPTKHGPVLVNRHDFYMGQAFMKYGECCDLELQFLLVLLRFPGLVIEVGSNMGALTIPLAAELARQGREMLALEPQPVIFQQLCANLALNGLMNVRALPYACGNENGAVSFVVPDYRSLGNFGATSMNSIPSDAARSAIVQCVRLDDLVGPADVGVIKIDVEGFELNVLKGCVGILERCKPVLYVENDRVEQSAELIQWLLDHGYRLWWHMPPLFNPDNYLGVKENPYPGIVSCNMLCVPRSRAATIEGLTEIVDASVHPWIRN